MVSAKGKKGGKKCRKCVCKGSVDVLDGMARKGLTEKVTREQRPERGEVSHAHIWGRLFQAEGTADAEVRSRICGSPSFTRTLEQRGRQDPHAGLLTPPSLPSS